MHESDQDKALEYYRLAIKQDQYNSDAYFNLGLMKLNSEDTSDKQEGL